jgi:hypothetical protein
MAINEEAENAILERFGIHGVRLDNIEEVYNPIKSGMGSMAETRKHLI